MKNEKNALKNVKLNGNLQKVLDTPADEEKENNPKDGRGDT